MSPGCDLCFAAQCEFTSLFLNAMVLPTLLLVCKHSYFIGLLIAWPREGGISWAYGKSSAVGPIFIATIMGLRESQCCSGLREQQPGINSAAGFQQYRCCWALGNRNSCVIQPQGILSGNQVSWVLGNHCAIWPQEIVSGIEVQQVLGNSAWNSRTVGPQERVPGIQAHLGFRECKRCWTFGSSGSLWFQGLAMQLDFRGESHCWTLGDSAWNSGTAGFQAVVLLFGHRDQFLEQCQLILGSSHAFVSDWIIPGIQSELGSRECWLWKALGNGACNNSTAGFREQYLEQQHRWVLGNRDTVGIQEIMLGIVVHQIFTEQCLEI